VKDSPIRYTQDHLPDVMQVLRWRPGSGYDDPEVVATFVPDKHCLIHSFAITQAHVIFLCSPLTLTLRKMADFYKLDIR
jgi:hypothetical protein